MSEFKSGYKPLTIKDNFISFLKFLIPSTLGILLFMIPVTYDDKITIPVAIFSSMLQGAITELLVPIVTAIIVTTAILTIITKILKPKFIIENSFLNNLFNVTPLWFGARIIGGIFVLCTFYKIGPEFIWSEGTGGLLLSVEGLLPPLFSIFIFAGLFLPLLLDFGLLEFFGTLLTKIMRPLFKLPGRSSIDCIASWLGDGSIGILLTSKQYEEGFYTKREAAVIGTTFSAVSITFSLIIISQVGLSHMFIPFYLTVTAAGIVAALICPRIPPLSRKSDTYYKSKASKNNEVIPANMNSFTFGISKALEKANSVEKPFSFLNNGFKNVLEMWFSVLPVVMAFGTLALIVAEFTPIFQWLGLPFIPILNLLQIPEAAAASQTLVVGFADMFLPSVLASSITSDLTRFVIAAVSVTQLIYMSEVGALLLGSKIPVNFKELLIIFLQRTIITLPIIAIIGHIIFK